jgi:hypothetical protein
MQVLLHPQPPFLGYFPSILPSLPPFQLLSFLHKVTLALTLSLEHLAPLYTPSPTVSTLLSRAEGAVVNALGESNRLLTGEIRPLLDGLETVEERKELVDKLKNDIVESLVNERIIKAKA